MSWLKRAAIKGQQAPTGRPTFSSRQSLRLDPLQTASHNRNRKVGHTSAISSAAPSAVRIVFGTLPKRRCRNMLGSPAPVGGGSSGAISRRTKASSVASFIVSPLADPDAGVVDVHGQTRRQRDQEIDKHRD